MKKVFLSTALSFFVSSIFAQVTGAVDVAKFTAEFEASTRTNLVLAVKDARIDKMYANAVMMLTPWAWEDEYVPLFKAEIKDKELLEQFLSPELNPKPAMLNPKEGE